MRRSKEKPILISISKNKDSNYYRNWKWSFISSNVQHGRRASLSQIAHVAKGWPSSVVNRKNDRKELSNIDFCFGYVLMLRGHKKEIISRIFGIVERSKIHEEQNAEILVWTDGYIYRTHVLQAWSFVELTSKFFWDSFGQYESADIVDRRKYYINLA